MKKINITTNASDLIPKCKELADKYNLTYTESPQDYFLLLEEDKLSLSSATEKNFKPFYIDFCHGKMSFRLQHVSLKNELLAKALGLKKILKLQEKVKVLDVTAGLGRDGFIMACLGCDVTMLERNKVLYLLLNDALKRFEKTFPDECSQINLKLYYADGLQFLETSDNYDVIYLDPMFPSRKKSALVKKDMQLLQTIVGDDLDAGELLNKNLNKAIHRVVVKRPVYAETLTKQNPNFQYKGKTIRYDVYSLSV